MDMFEKRTGLSELMYGQSSHQYRSAAEADVKQSQTSIRPDDMAKKVEKMAGKVASREALAARWHMTGQDVGAVFGPVIGGLWDQLVATADLSQIIHQIQFSVQAGTARKRNKNKDVSDAKDALQIMLPLYQQVFAATGDPAQINALISFWGKANDIDVTEMLFKTMPPPPPAMPPGQSQPQSQPQGGQPQPSSNGKQTVAA